MSKKANTTILGAFVVVGAVLFVILVLSLGSFSFLRTGSRYIVFFDESVSGLTVGSKVKFRGVPFGEVREILFRVPGQSEEDSSIPVIIQLDNGGLVDRGFDSRQNPLRDAEALKAAVDRGFRAQLRMESLLTGQSFIELAYGGGASEPHYVLPERVFNGDIAEIPARPSAFAKLEANAPEIMAKIAGTDFYGAVEQIKSTAAAIERRTEEADIAGAVARFSAAAESINALASDAELKIGIARVASFAEKLDRVADTIEKRLPENMDKFNTMTEDLGTSLKFARESLEGARDTLAATEKAMRQLVDILGQDSSVRMDLERTLKSLSRMSGALESLADYMERNPDAWITGKPKPFTGPRSEPTKKEEKK